MDVYAPLDGIIHELAGLPDPVFSAEMVGPGLAIEPAGQSTVIATSPIAGTVGALHPHAYAIAGEGGDVLVHLGLDTVTLRGTGFRTLVSQGEQVVRGQAITEWDLSVIGALSPLVPLIALSARHLTMHVSPGEHVSEGQRLYTIGSV